MGVLLGLTAADHVAAALTVLRADALEEEGRRELLACRGLEALRRHAAARASGATPHLGPVLDVLLGLVTDSAVAPAVLEALAGGEGWCPSLLEHFGRAATEPRNLELAERLAVLLQKLSRLPQTRPHFLRARAATTVHALLRAHGEERPFLALNLRSLKAHLEEGP